MTTPYRCRRERQGAPPWSVAAARPAGDPAAVLAIGALAWYLGVEAEWFEVLVGGTKNQFLRYALFEREALGEAQGQRHLLAERTHPKTPLSDVLTCQSLMGDG